MKESSARTVHGTTQSRSRGAVGSCLCGDHAADPAQLYATPDQQASRVRLNKHPTRRFLGPCMYERPLEMMTSISRATEHMSKHLGRLILVPCSLSPPLIPSF